GARPQTPGIRGRLLAALRRRHGKGAGAMSDLLRETAARVRSFFRKDALDRDLDSELRAHIELATDDHIRAGLPPHEARRRAMLQFGGLDPARELHRDARGLPLLDTLFQDLRYAFRTLKRDAVFTTF